jgi:hypothetical protein
MLTYISDKIKEELLENAEIYSFDDPIDVKVLFGGSRGLITRFKSYNGQTYSVLHTIYGDINEFKTKLDYYMNWTLQLHLIDKNRNKYIYEYINKYGCSTTYICFISPSMASIKSIPLNEINLILK